MHIARVTEAAPKLANEQPITLVCNNCGSSRLHRSRTRGFKERVLKYLDGVRAWRCDECNSRQLSALRPKRWRRNREERDFRPNPGPDPKPAPSPEPRPDPLPMPDPKPRRSRRRDPLAEKLKYRRRKRMLITAALVVVAGLAGALLVMKASRPVPQQVEVVD